MKNIILFILLIILVIIYYKNYFSIKEDFKGISSVSEMMKQGEPAFDVPVASIIALNEQLQSISGKKNDKEDKDKEIEGFTGDSGISCDELYTHLLKSQDSSFNHFKDLYKNEKDKDDEEQDPKKKTEYLSGMVRESILLGCSGECTIDIKGIDNNAEICKNVEKIDEDLIEQRIIEYKKIIKDLWEAEDEKDDERARWDEWDKYLSNNDTNNYEKHNTYGTMPNKGLKPEVETSWFGL